MSVRTSPSTLSKVLAAGLYAAWLWPLLPWIARSAAGEEGMVRASALLAGAWMGLSARRFEGPPSAIAPWVAALPALLAPLCRDLETLQLMLVAVSGYGLLGLFVGANAWRKLAPLLLLALACAPDPIQLDVMFGWPLRKAIASIAAAILGGVPAETVIAVEGGIAHVDLPCAGMRSLWMIGVLMLIVGLWQRRGLDVRFLVASTLAGLAMIAANTIRVVILVALAHTWGLPMLADSVHVPIGIFGFAASLGAGLAALRLLGEAGEETAEVYAVRRQVPAWVPAIALIVPLLAPAPARELASTERAPLPDGWSELAPSPIEQRFAGEHGAALTKARHPEGASVVMVASESWLAHHVPEQCLVADGWRLVEDHPALIGGLPVRLARLRRGSEVATAIWWFQRGELLTDDLVFRIRQGGRWVLVSVLLPGDVPEGELTDFLEPMRAAASMGETG